MVIVDTSAWVEFFKNGEPEIVNKVERCLKDELVAIGDLIYCEVMQGIRALREREKISALLLALPQYEMVGFRIAKKSAHNYRLLRERGVTIRKTMDVLIGTFCAENKIGIVHIDRDFDLMAAHIGLKVL
jgi:predicted nucleic acid-binding protein